MRSQVLSTVCSIALIGASSLPQARPAVAAESELEAGGGVHVAFGSRESDVYGAAGALTLGYTRRLPPPGRETDTRVFLDASYLWASGAVVNDPTFLVPEERYWLLPLVVGIRTNFVRSEAQQPFGLYGGFGLATVLSGYRDMNGDTHDSPSFGALFELRPEFRITDTVSLWVRDRIWVLGKIDYSDLARGLNFSGNTLEAGLGWGLR